MSYRKAAQWIDEQFQLDDPQQALHNALEELDKVPPRKRDADWHYLRGFCCYDLGQAEEAEREFRTALLLQPEQRWAVLYLGHALFDRGEYAEALPYFQRARLEQPWRILKNQELMLCCRLYTQSRLPNIQVLRDLVELYEKHPKDAPEPTEMVLCIDRLQERIPVKRRAEWWECLQRLVKVGGGASLQPILDRLEASLASGVKASR
ncbi:MAG: tetratricopeptide repeat protein [Candidatus Eremiobacteraeota bacterium]|nr:tetratricopeptide repeat protein [Candidatus Eremiobacteraeota bacterium]MCW5866975.1 tetratricopeptide repeat protein [Candidatus Eremiobacteraeota bacterium]